MYRIAIVDDDIEASNNLSNLLKQYQQESGDEFEIEIFDTAESFLEVFKCDFAILFLDVQLPHISGMEIAEKVREKDKKVFIIFETEFAQYALQGYKFDATDYFVKPVSYYDLKMRMMMLKEKTKTLTPPPTKNLFIPVKGGGVSLPASAVLYVEQYGHHQIYHTTQEELETSKRSSLSSLEKELSAFHFARCSSSYLVNLDHCSGIQNDVALVGDTKLPISRGMKKSFTEKFMELLNKSKDN